MKHYRRGEKPCEACRIGWNEYQRLYRRHGPVAKPHFASSRIYDFLLVNEPVSIRGIVDGVEGAESTILRAVYRMRNRGEITCNFVTRHYTIDRQEG